MGIIQWNLNGYNNNYNELLALIKTYTPKIICLQETHIHNMNNISIPINYTMYSINTSNSRYGGVSILVHNSLQHRQIFLGRDPTIDTICIEIVSKIKFHIYSSYIPPNQNFSLQNLERVFYNSTIPSIITGDFNSWHVSWGSSSNNGRGKTLAKFINDSDYVLLNDKSPTHFSTHGTFSHIDISFCSSTIATCSDWQILGNLYGSDHFPIIISLFPNTNINPSSTNFRPKFKTESADWKLFQDKCLFFDSLRSISNNVNMEAANISKITKKFLGGIKILKI